MPRRPIDRAPPAEVKQGEAARAGRTWGHGSQDQRGKAALGYFYKAKVGQAHVLPRSVVLVVPGEQVLQRRGRDGGDKYDVCSCARV